MRAKTRLLLGAAVLTASVSCMMRKSAVWLDGASTTQRPVIGLARERHGSEPVIHLNYVAVRSCYTSDKPQQTYWQARGELPPGTTVPTRIVYGVAPSGFNTEVAPQGLAPGCYEEIVSGNGVSGTVRFIIASDETIHEQDKAAGS